MLTHPRVCTQRSGVRTVGDQKRNTGNVVQAHELVGNKDNTRGWTRGHSCYTLAKNLAVF